MRRFVAKRYRSTASALIIALVAFCANCVQSAESTPAPTAAHAAMPDDCPMSAEHGACAGEALKVEQGPVAKQLAFSPPSLVLVFILADVEAPRLRSSWNRDVSGPALRPPSVPTYILDSTFRI